MLIDGEAGAVPQIPIPVSATLCDIEVGKNQVALIADAVAWRGEQVIIVAGSELQAPHHVVAPRGVR